MKVSSKELKSWLVPSVLVAGGIGLLSFGLRPKTQREQIAETVSYWSPPQQTLTSTEHRNVDAMHAKMNELRREIRAVWVARAAKRDGLNISADDQQAAYERSNYPWPVQRLGVATFNIRNPEAESYTTELIAPPLQTAFAQLDVALFESSLANMEQTITARKALSVLRSIKGERLLWLAATYAAAGGTHIRAVAASNYEICAAHELKSDTQDAILANNPVLTWLAINSPLSDLNAAERKTQRSLRKQKCRTPRVLIP